MNAVVRAVAGQMLMGAWLAMMLLVSATAQATTSYVATRNVTTSQGELVPAGSTVEVLGIHRVPQSLSPSGELITFVVAGKIFTADAAGFTLATTQAPFVSASWTFQASGAQARVCTNFYTRDSEYLLWPVQQDLQQYLRVTHSSGPQQGQAVSFSVNRPGEMPEQRPRRYYDYLVESAQLCIERLAYAADYQVELLPGLALRSCAAESCTAMTLEAPLQLFASTERRPAEILLPQGKTILPMHEQAVLPITVTHVDSLNLQLYQVDLRSISNAYDLFQNLNSYDAEYFAQGVGLSVGSYSVPLGAAELQEQRFNLDLNRYLPRDQQGLFVAILDAPELPRERWEARPTQWLLRSNMGVTSFHGQQHVDVWLQSFDQANAISGADVQVIAKNNRLLFSGQTDSDGRVRIARAMLSGEGDHAPEFLLARSQQQGIALLPFSAGGQALANQSSVAADGQALIYLTSDRDLYRGGDPIEWLLVARDKDLNAQIQQDYQLRLLNPQRELFLTRTISTDSNGMAAAQIALPAQAELGAYQLQVLSMDGRILARHDVNVDDFVPLTIAARLEGPAQVEHQQDFTWQVGADYLAGGVAADLNAELRLALSGRNVHEDKRWQGYFFGSQMNLYQYFSEQQGRLDSQGQWSLTLNSEAAPIETMALYSLGIEAAVFDASGRANNARQRVALNTHPRYLGVRALSGTEQAQFEQGQPVQFRLQNIDRAGTEQELGEVSYELRKVEYSYDWYYQQQEGWRYRLKRLADQLLEQGTAKQATLSFRDDLSWGWYELSVRNSDGFQTVLPFQIGWGSGAALNEPEVLALQVNEQDGWLQVNVRLPFAGQLRVLQAGSDIEAVESFSLAAGDQQLRVRKQSTSEPGFYVLVQLIRPIARGSEHLPQLAMGSQWLSQLQPERLISTEIDAPQRTSTEPLQVTARFSTATGKARIFLVDEGIHAINRYSNGQAQQFFYGARRYGLGFLSNYGQLLQQDDSLRRVAVGGDRERIMVTGSMAFEVSDQVIEKSDFFDTVAVASPLLEIVDGQVQYRFPPAQMEGRLRIVVISANASGVGYQEATLLVRDAVSMGLGLPRFLSPGDELLSKLLLRFHTDQAALQLSQLFGSARKNQLLNGQKGQQQTIDWLLRSDQVGDFPININLQNAALNIDRDYRLVVRDASYPSTHLLSFPVARSGQVPAIDFSHFAEPNQLRLNWSLSTWSGASLKQAVAGLNRYPYGCLEQTSSGLRGLLAWVAVYGMTAEQQQQMQQAVHQLAAKQTSSGGFGYWSRREQVDPLYTLYATDTLLQVIPYLADPQPAEQAIEKALQYIDQQFFHEAWTALYANGLLQQQGFEVTSRARYAIDEQLPRALQRSREQAASASSWQQQYQSAEQRDLLIAGYWLAAKLQDDARMKALEQQLSDWYQQNYSLRQRLGEWLGHSPVLEPLARSRSAMLLASIAPTQQSATLQKLSQQLAQGLANMKYRSTWDNAGLAALLQHAKVMTPEQVALKINGQPIQDWRDISLSQAAQGFRVGHQHPQPLYLSVELEGLRQGTDADAQGLRVSKTWFDSQGNVVSHNDQPWQVSQGTLLTVLLSITADHDINQERLMVTDLLPAGFELVNNEADPWVLDSKQQRVAASRLVSTPERLERMDDRFSAALNPSLRSGRPIYLVYQVRASFVGQMQVPDAHAELMYRPEYHGRSARTTVQVTPR